MFSVSEAEEQEHRSAIALYTLSEWSLTIMERLVCSNSLSYINIEDINTPSIQTLPLHHYEITDHLHTQNK